jgi:predicted metalloprotease
MRWGEGRESDNVEDRRGLSMSSGLVGGGIGTVVIVVAALFFGVDPRVALQLLSDTAPVAQQAPATASDSHDPLRKFVSVVLADTEDTWQELFRQSGRHYENPKLVLFTGAINSACGYAQSAVGPFYCSADHKVYIDLAFYRDLKERFHAPGDFAQAYVIAHEVGHHVQNLLGIANKVHAARARATEAQGNALSVRMELQADCLAGVWAFHANRVRHILETGDVEQALNAASQIGDDRIQMRARGHVSPESFTHGSAAQRVHWFRKGIETGQLAQCDTFKSAQF